MNVVDHFLEDVRLHGRYSGVCGLGVRLQGMENDFLRQHYGMGEDDTGVLVLFTAPTAPSAQFLKKGDVILSVDDIKVQQVQPNTENSTPCTHVRVHTCIICAQ